MTFSSLVLHFQKRKRAPLYDKKNEAIIKDLNEKISEMQLELDQHSVDASSSQVEVLQLTQVRPCELSNFYVDDIDQA